MTWINTMMFKISLLLITFIVLVSCSPYKKNENEAIDYWAGQLLKVVTVEGTAYNSKMGAFLENDDKGDIWVASLDAWPDGYQGKRVIVTGIVVKRHDLPVFVQKEGEPARSGIPVPEGTDLHEASGRYLLENAEWEILE